MEEVTAGSEDANESDASAGYQHVRGGVWMRRKVRRSKTFAFPTAASRAIYGRHIHCLLDKTATPPRNHSSNGHYFGEDKI